MSADFRERCRGLASKLARDGILRQNDPVTTIMEFVTAEKKLADAQRAADPSENFDPFIKVEPPQEMRACACCGGAPELWKVRKKDGEIVGYVPGCSTMEPDELDRRPCPNWDPRHLQCATKKATVIEWNRFNDALQKMRESRS